MKTSSAIAVSIILLISCGTDPADDNKVQSIVIEERIAFPDSAKELEFGSLRPETQKFVVDSRQDTLIVGNNGTTVFIPQNSFVNSDGEAPIGPVEIQLIEVVTREAILRSNLQTLSDGKFLQTEGMIYIDALADQKKVSLASGKEMQIEMPELYSSAVGDPQIFSGQYDANGKINWTLTEQDNEEYMICLPIEIFNYEFWKSFEFTRVDGGGYSVSFDDVAEVDSTTLRNRALNNTFIATREFKERFDFINAAQSAIGHFTCYENTKVKSGSMIMDSAITALYLSNIDKPLWYCDSLAYEYLLQWDYKVDFNDNFFSEVDSTDLIAAFKTFYQQKKEKLLKVPEENLSGDLRSQLAAQGFDASEIDEMIGAYNLQKRLIASARDSIAVVKIRKNTFSINKLGWVNCDIFYSDPSAIPCDLLVTVSNQDEFNHIELSLVMNARNIFLNAIHLKDEAYSFEYGPSKKVMLPVGQHGTLVAISYKDGAPYISVVDITMEASGEYEVELVKSTEEELATKLSEIW